MKRHPLTSMVALGFLLLAACAGIEQSTNPTTTVARAVPTSTTSSGLQLSAEQVPRPDIDGNLTGQELLVAIEARWMCDVQRFAFSDLDSMNEALTQRLAPHGVSRPDYNAFKVDLEDRIDLRGGGDQAAGRVT